MPVSRFHVVAAACVTLLAAGALLDAQARKAPASAVTFDRP